MGQAYRYISGDAHLEVDSKYWFPWVPVERRGRAPRLVRLSNGAMAGQ